MSVFNPLQPRAAFQYPLKIPGFNKLIKLPSLKKNFLNFLKENGIFFFTNSFM